MAWTAPDRNGLIFEIPDPPDGAICPVICTHCGAAYDLCAGVPIEGGRGPTCTVFTTPCCGRQAREETGSRDYRPYPKDVIR